ncbi:CaiB/BaiF CoA transferase family protein [Bordetella petrii]|uniref:CaiB/BaiF CoA transferase family protein n=1 Tax=Bordetella petrii TaxID=94624 RepID=UPI001A95D781|nr:CaiB/BaiF CoA-transferase family protein [Bordetella petrii]MBO1114793.1 CoA transferase [Bordetella petrii]
MKGPLAGFRVLELETPGPVPWAGMMLADMGATVIRIERPTPADMGIPRDARFELTARGKQAVAADLKTEAGRQAVLDLVADADVLLEGLRPGVMERLGLGPDACWARNAALVYGRVTGWGQTGPLAQAVGHDINYLAASGVLHGIGPEAGPPAVPLNLIGDFGAGGMLLLTGVLAALLEARQSGKGQIVDAAMVDGALSMLAPILGRWQCGQWRDRRASNLLDGGAPFYTTYATSDGKAVAVGAIEPRFYAALLAGLGLDPGSLPGQHDQASWPGMRARLAGIFAGHTRDHWAGVFQDTEACVTPVLSLSEVPRHPHFVARSSFERIDQVLHPAPSPRFSRTPGAISAPPAKRAG